MILEEKDEYLLKSLGHNTFSASIGWIDEVKKRNNIAFRNICGESVSFNKDSCDEWKRKLPTLI